MYNIHLQAVEIVGAGVTVSPDIRASLFALQNSFYLNLALEHTCRHICLCFIWCLGINNKYMRGKFVCDLIANYLCLHTGIAIVFVSDHKLLVNGSYVLYVL